MKLNTLFRRSRFPVLGALILAPFIATAASNAVSAAGFGTDDRVSRLREKGTIYGAIGLVVHSDGLESEAGTGFLVSPCHVMTAYHVVAGKRKITEKDTATFYVGEGDLGPDYSGGRRYAESSVAHPVVWGNFIDGESDNVTQRVKAVQSNGWNDWVLLKLDKCLGGSTSNLSAAGHYQFSTQTWLGTFKAHAGEHGKGDLAAAITKRADGRYTVADAAARKRILDLRKDPALNAALAAALASDNKAKLEAALGRAATTTDLQLAHLLGLKGALRFVRALDSAPSDAGAAMFPRVAKANPSDFYDGRGHARTLAEIYQRMSATAEGDKAFAAQSVGNTGEGWGYLKLDPMATRDITRAGETPAAIAVGLPKDKDEKALTEDPNCRMVGQMYESGWQHDCFTLPGNSGGPILERKAAEGAPGDSAWPRVIGITVSLILLDGMDPEAAEEAMLSTDDPSYFSLLSTAVPVSAFINKVAQYLPQDPEVSAYIAKHSLDTGYSRGEEIDYEASIADLDQAVKAKPQDAELRLRHGLWEAASGDTDTAIDDYTAALKLAPDYPAALLSRSQSLSDRDDKAKRDLDTAISDLTALIGRFKDSAELILNRGYILSRDRRLPEAIADFSDVLKLRPKSSGALRARAGIYAEQKQFDMAAADYDHAVELEPNLPVSYIARGNFRSQLGQDAEAIADFDRAIQLYPSAAEAYSGRGYVLLQQGDFKGAIKSFDQALNHDEKATYVLGGRASTYQILGDHDAAIRDYKKAVELDPGEPFIQLLYFVEQARAGKADEAKKNFTTFAADPRYDEWPRALARFLAGEIDAAAIEKLAAAGETEYERHARAFDRDFYLGQAALIAGNNGEAETRLNAVVATGDRQYIEYNIAAADAAKLKGIAQTTAPINTTQN